MPFFDAAAEAVLAGHTVRVALGVAFAFASGTMRVWRGFGVVDHGGFAWSGLGELGSIGDFEMGPGLPTQPVEMVLSGVDAALLAILPEQEAEVRGRAARVHLLIFDDDWRPLNEPYVLRTLIMDRMSWELDMENATAIITLTGEPLLATKHLAPHGNLTDHDQTARAPGDRGLERAGLYSSYTTAPWAANQ